MATLNNNIDSVMNVCRLCLDENNLISIFDNRIEIPDNMKDVVLVTTGVNISPTDDVSQMLCYNCVKITINMFKFRSSSIVNDWELKEKSAKRKSELHKSIQTLLKQHPKIIVPSSLTKIDIAPKVRINKKEVTDWIEKYRKNKELQKKKQRASRNGSKDKKQKINEADSKIDLHIKSETGDMISKEKTESSEERKPSETNLESMPAQSNVAIDVSVGSSESGPNRKKKFVESNSDHNTSPTSNSAENKSKRKQDLGLTQPDAKKIKLVSEIAKADTSTSSLFDVKYVSGSVFICEVCNNVFYNNKSLKKHLTKHMRCSICKKKFLSMEETKEHCEKHCVIKKMMNNLPQIRLRRCEKIEEIRKSYPSAFGVTSKKDSTIERTSSHDITPAGMSLEKIDVIPPTPPSEKVHEILLVSDDEDISKPESISGATNPSSAKSTNECPKISNDTDKSIPSPTINPTCGRKPYKNVPHYQPDLKIIGENILDLNLDDSEMSLFMDILKRSDSQKKNSTAQTYLPEYSDIFTAFNRNKLYELRNTKHLLNFHKIPVNISYAKDYSIKYGYDTTQWLKKDAAWSVVESKKDSTKMPKSTSSSISNAKPIPAPTSNPVVSTVLPTKPNSTAPEPNVSTATSNSVPFLIFTSTSHSVSSISNATVNTTSNSISNLIPVTNQDATSRANVTQTFPTSSTTVIATSNSSSTTNSLTVQETACIPSPIVSNQTAGIDITPILTVLPNIRNCVSLSEENTSFNSSPMNHQKAISHDQGNLKSNHNGKNITTCVTSSSIQRNVTTNTTPQNSFYTNPNMTTVVYWPSMGTYGLPSIVQNTNQTSLVSINTSNIQNVNKTSLASVYTNNLQNVNKTSPASVNSSNCQNVNKTSLTSINASNGHIVNKTSLASVNTSNVQDANKTSIASVYTNNLQNVNETSLASVNSNNCHNVDKTSLVSINASNGHIVNKTSLASVNTSNVQNANKTPIASVHTNNLQNVDETFLASINASNGHILNKTSLASIIPSNLQTSVNSAIIRTNTLPMPKRKNSQVPNVTLPHPRREVSAFQKKSTSPLATASFTSSNISPISVINSTLSNSKTNVVNGRAKTSNKSNHLPLIAPKRMMKEMLRQHRQNIVVYNTKNTIGTTSTASFNNNSTLSNNTANTFSVPKVQTKHSTVCDQERNDNTNSGSTASKPNGKNIETICTTPTNFAPMIRVRNISELR